MDALDIVAFYLKDGYNASALDNDTEIIYLTLNTKLCPIDSPNGEKLLALGFHTTSKGWWARYV